MDNRQRDQNGEEYAANERRRMRRMLYADLRMHTAIPVREWYPEKANDEEEPSLNMWRQGYLTLKARENEWRFRFQMAGVLAVIGVLIWIIKTVFRL